jgi:hypothetical protein
MYKYIIILILLFINNFGYTQVFNANTGTVSNKPYSPAQKIPTDNRTMYFDATFQKWRPFLSTTEVLTYFPNLTNRFGLYPIVVNTGGSVSGGVISGGINDLYYFKNGTADSNLVLMNPVLSVNGQTNGNIIVKNADSLLGSRIDTSSAARNQYVLSFDSVNRKWVLIQPLTGYTAGVGILITGNTIAALNTNALWNSNALRGRAITTSAPATGNVLFWDGTQLSWGAGGGGGGSITGGFYSNDTLYIQTTTGNVGIPNSASKSYVDSLFQTVPIPQFDVTFLGTGTVADPYRLDTINYYATVTALNLINTNLTARIDSIIANFPTGGGGGSGKLDSIISRSNIGDSLLVKKNDSVQIQKKIIFGTNTSGTITDSTITINSSGGSAEINTDAFTITTSDTRAVVGGLITQFIEVNPSSDLNSFRVGTISDDDAYVFPTFCAGGTWTLIDVSRYFPAGATLYFSGITSSTQVKIVKFIQHQ